MKNYWLVLGNLYNMATKVYKYYSVLPKWGKGTVVVLVVGASLGALYGSYILIRDYIKKKKEEKLLKSVNNALAVLASHGITPTLTDAQYKIYADKIDECMQGYGTCNAWMQPFEAMTNDADILKLIEAFGVRTISSGKYNPEPDLLGDLPKVLVSELTAGHLQDLNTLLKSKNLSYQF